MNDGRDALSSRRVPHAEASANTHSMNNATSPVPHKPMPLPENQTIQSPQSLSLRIDGLNAVTVANGDGNPNPAYIESSQRGNNTSAGPDTDSISSLSSSLTNGVGHSADLGNHHISNGHTTRPRIDQELLEFQPAPQAQPVNGVPSIDRWQPSLPPIKAGNASLSPPPSPKQSPTGSNLDARLAPGQKRTAAGDFKSILEFPTAHSPDANGGARRRSKSTGSSAYGSRIAQVKRSLYDSSSVYNSFILPSCPSISVRDYHMRPPR